MNTAVLLFSACMAGADPVPPPPAAPAVVYYVNNNSGDNCGKASVCDDDCCFKKVKCCLIQKIKDKLCCWKKCCEKSNDCGNKYDNCNKNNNCNKNACDKGHQQNACAKQNDCAKNDCGNKKHCFKCDWCKKNDDCGKDACGRAEVSKCDDCCDKLCWKPGYFLHKCKEKLCGHCDKKDDCHGGCGTAATPNSCGSTVIVPANPGTGPAPVAPKKIPEKVGSTYPMIKPSLTAGDSPKTIDLTPSAY